MERQRVRACRAAAQAAAFLCNQRTTPPSSSPGTSWPLMGTMYGERAIGHSPPFFFFFVPLFLGYRWCVCGWVGGVECFLVLIASEVMESCFWCLYLSGGQPPYWEVLGRRLVGMSRPKGKILASAFGIRR